jgi:flagellar basal-body rod protein FlgG
MRALYTAATGMSAQQVKMDNIANNLANVGTTGFKKVRENFQDLYYQQLRAPAPTTVQGTQNSTGVQVGHGVQLASLRRAFEQGNAEITGNATDMMIDGPGFFQVQLPDGTLGYTRDGAFRLDQEGNLVTVDGYLLLPGINIPQGSVITVGADGSITSLLEGEEAATQLGQLELSTFTNAAGLAADGRNLFRATEASGDALTGLPGDEGIGQVLQHALEASNVDVAEELVNLIRAQRSYELASKVIETSDQVLQTTNQIKR